MPDDSDIRVRDYNDDSFTSYLSNSDRLYKMIRKLRAKYGVVQNYGSSLTIDEKDLNSTGGVYIP